MAYQPESTEEDEWELAVSSFKISIETTSGNNPLDLLLQKAEKQEALKTISLDKITISAKQASMYHNYGHFVHGLAGTMVKTLFGVVDIPEGKRLLREKLGTPECTLKSIVVWVRNDYLTPLFNVARSTVYYNPVHRKWVGNKKLMDPNLLQVSRDDQLKFYRLFDFTGFLNEKSQLENEKRDKLITFLRNIIYGNSSELVYFIDYLLYRISTEIKFNKNELIKICKEFEYDECNNTKKYFFPTKWHNLY